jgi:2-polyprenyl-6-methoxyphenol hydroxylase-like FAD-dependent oxidoreductase
MSLPAFHEVHGAVDTQVLIAGAGPVGLTLAIDLARRGIDVTVAERRHAGEPPQARCNQVSARSMEFFRRLGIAQKLRAVGLPLDYPNDVACRTTATGIEIARIAIPSRAERYQATDGPDGWWPTPEPPHRVNQIYLEAELFAHAASQERIRILNRTEIEDLSQDDRGVAAKARDLDTGKERSITSLFAVGCDGARSVVRKRIGAQLTGTPVLQRVQSTCIRAPGLLDLMPGKRAWLYLSFNPRRSGSMIAIDGRETWQVHNWLYGGESDFDSIDRDWALRAILGVDEDFEYEVISQENWVARRLVADRFRDRRVLICGDAAHLWIPHAGYGMNAGIADATNLSWMLAATLNGWAPITILDAYEAERQPITDQVSRFAMDAALSNTKQRREIPQEIEWPGPVGDATRARIGAQAYDLYLQQQCCGGLNFGYFYQGSPIIAYDSEPQPAYTMHDFTPSSVPGCRAPHLWLMDGRSLYDCFGQDYTLLRTSPLVEASGLDAAAARRGVPLTILDIEPPDEPQLYPRALTLVRPDQHVAWRGDQAPAAPLDLIDRMRGAHIGRQG